MAEPNTALAWLDKLITDGVVNHHSVEDVCRSIASKDMSLLTLIEHLGPDLLDPDPKKRCSAVSFVAKSIETLLPGLHVDEKEIEVLAEFFCSKLKDHHSILPAALHGLATLSSSQDLPQGLVKKILGAIFADVHCQSQLQNDRRNVFRILKNFLSFKMKEIQSISQDFVFGFIQAVDGERDPRNILIIFSMIPVIVKFLTLEPFVEDFFEVFSCYFPVDFTPPAEDPLGVTREQLVDGLRQCMASSRQFADYCLPLLQSKMESDLLSAKIDAWRTLEVCCAGYGAAELESWMETFCQLARKELLVNVNGDELEHAVLDALTGLSKVFDASPSASSLKVLTDLMNECSGHLREPERRLMVPSLNVLRAMCAGSRYACARITNEAVPLLMGQYETRKEATPRRFVVNSLNQMVHAGLSGLSDGVAVDGVRRWADASFELYLTILNDQDDATLKSLSLEGLAHFLAVDIKDDEWRRVGQALIDLLLRRRPEETISRSIRSFLTAMAARQEDVFGLDVVPQLLHHMDRGDAELKASLMKTICHLPLGPAMLERVVSRLVDVLTADSGDDQVRVGALRALTELCRTQETWFAQQVDIFRRLHAWALAAVRANDTVRCPEMVEASSLLLRSLASRLKPSDARDSAAQLTATYDGTTLAECPAAVIIMEAALGSLDALIEGPTLDNVLRALEPLAVGSSDGLIARSACRLMAAVVNKLPEGADLDALVDSLSQRIDRLFESDAASAVHLFVWIAKGLTVRAYSRLDAVLEKLVNYLDDEEVRHVAAQGFGTILSDTVQCLNAASHANIKLLYRQRFFHMTVPRLLATHRRAGGANAACLAAIANQLAHIPHAVLLSKMATLLPMLVQCLASDQDAVLIESTIKALMALMPENSDPIVEHIDTLVPRLVLLAKEGRSMSVRMLALKSLGQLTDAPKIVVLPLRSRVVFQLIPCLDDRKRLVRREAALARHKWIMLGQPGGLAAQ